MSQKVKLEVNSVSFPTVCNNLLLGSVCQRIQLCLLHGLSFLHLT